eukprot:906974-Prymnesium_polylepis.1
MCTGCQPHGCQAPPMPPAGIASSGSQRSSGKLHALAMCCLGFLDVLTRFFNEFAYTQARGPHPPAP